ncbi:MULTISPECIES: cation transporter [Leucobacter]|uniref:Copper chaperone CopZ n=1 Tax=Leucobacter chromiiresistens TaxID=1079994 RepID=A0A1H0YIB7_9MICO|nr:cation transporter [Leucobacter chromiiresistens]SDQ14666.1 Copper chaperone CopZ [Leucobacter chromiiresistens]
MDATSKQELTVSGMTCDHCAQTLTTAVSALSGVDTVEVDVTSGRAILHAAHPLSTDALAAAVSEAGFELTAVRERAR